MSSNLSKNACYQFNLYSGYDFIQGYIIDQDEYFFEIKLKDSKTFQTKTKSIDDTIYFSKSAIKYFFKISEN